MAVKWYIKPGRLRLLYISFITVFTFGYLFYLRFCAFHRKGITKSNFIPENELGWNMPQGHPSFPKATLSDEFLPTTSNVTVSDGNKNMTRYPLNLSLSMEGCPEGWHLEILRETSYQQHTAQVCSSNSGNGDWKCAAGWRKLSFDPFCIRSLSSSKLSDRMSTILHPKYAQVSHNRKLLFIHVPKAGGTSIESSFLFHDQRERLGGHYLGGHHKITKFDKQFFKSYHKFCIVRHPCSRLLSVWAFYAQGLGNARNKQWADKFMDNETKSSFDAFVERTLYPGGPVKVNKQVHLQTQIGMLFDEKGLFGLDQLLIYEKWQDSMDQLGKRININVTTLKSTHMNFSRHKACQESYTSKIWAKMTQIYAMDFCVLGYSNEFEKVNVTPPIDLTPEDLTARFNKCASKISQGV